MNQLQPLWGLGGSPLETGGRNSRLTHNRLFSGPEVLLRRSVPVPGILAAHRTRGDYG
jgi:hypothetical protein